ncbi:Subtilase 1.3 [Tripterygium wilfordii]|uniref:Subtilase 1.3 n=1 Tax=Tripterygium wilfordii TaxID=458696 RepID=A0A7J7DBD6_TRIWF|nr:Subtilase 1.3 [Tripterygium wilfordii]
MDEYPVKWLFFILTIHLAFNLVLCSQMPSTKKTYIVQMDKTSMPQSFSSHLEWYSSKVKSVVSKQEKQGDDGNKERIIYNYETAFHGMAAQLSEEEAEKLEDQDGVMTIFPETIYQLHTTRSPKFLGLEREDSSNSSSPDPSSLCLEGTLDPHKVGGKIVICDRGINPRVQKGQVVKDSGGIGMILTNTAANGEELVADCHLLPAVAVGEMHGKAIKHYALTNRNATATLAFLGTKLGIKPSPVVAAFSSRGPNFLTLEILKPDLVAPGVDILAAWTGDLSPSSLPTDHRKVKFNILSGTSMSCPHVSGIAALLKAKHPEWSPAAIKSALMTTAYVHDNIKGPLKDASTAAPSTPFEHGAGHINPLKALDPGLIYDIEPQDYFEFLCTQRLTPTQLSVFGKYSNRSCHHSLASPGDLNYPAVSVVFPDNSSTLTIHRTVTNVGPPISNYHVAVSPFKGAIVKVEPQTLNFTGRNQKLSYKITFVTKYHQTIPEFGGLLWKNALHKVRSPIIITWLLPI